MLSLQTGPAILSCIIWKNSRNHQQIDSICESWCHFTVASKNCETPAYIHKAQAAWAMARIFNKILKKGLVKPVMKCCPARTRNVAAAVSGKHQLRNANAGLFVQKQWRLLTPLPISLSASEVQHIFPEASSYLVRKAGKLKHDCVTAHILWVYLHSEKYVSTHTAQTVTCMSKPSVMPLNRHFHERT